MPDTLINISNRVLKTTEYSPWTTAYRGRPYQVDGVVHIIKEDGTKKTLCGKYPESIVTIWRGSDIAGNLDNWDKPKNLEPNGKLEIYTFDNHVCFSCKKSAIRQKLLKEE